VACGGTLLTPYILVSINSFQNRQRKQTMDEEQTQQPLFQFPCEFVIKVFGLASSEFETAVLTIIRNHVSDLKENALRTRPSKDGKYLAITITFNAENREQIDEIYRDLSSNSHVLMAL
jgi:hypothetical protein